MSASQFLGNSKDYVNILTNITEEVESINNNFIGRDGASAKVNAMLNFAGITNNEDAQNWAYDQVQFYINQYNDQNTFQNVLVRNQDGIDEYWLCTRSNWTLEFSFN